LTDCVKEEGEKWVEHSVDPNPTNYFVPKLGEPFKPLRACPADTHQKQKHYCVAYGARSDKNTILPEFPR
jgi:hypothetical protein